ncbi:DUF1292 domain-containing protein [Paenactinomyces guangxiensis]|uniref:DUF1292 domain-containing protein n=1 Tax=Paenactinomyces guangxiensis TaxID=1490290 RepID=A0A7W1WNC8_9BACL|nr:DUF1292 domain-containing protein [Paenactinomyces guangxiensis]MBA4493020.1 DUF1292 domain-containing protein [Paenactinomyces guangxiensis]MBH8590131.1 DUF1292 domain-containing protein [Paenactinomyces guangxiensis]
MNQPSQPLAKEVYILRNELSPDQLFIRPNPDGKQESYRVLNEVEVDGQHYAVMHKQNDHPDDAYIFRIKQNQAEEIDDETEWERIADALDEMLYFYDT